MEKRILIVSAHPDDEILGCGGTSARLAAEKNQVYTMILGEGATSREKNRDREKSRIDLNRLKEQCRLANKIIGVRDLILHDFPDNRFDTVPFLDIVKTVERAKGKIKPDVIFTHFAHDLNLDHRITYQAVLTATRPIRGETVKEIYSFEILSSSEWNYPSNFNPNIFIDIENTLALKLDAMKLYKQELQKFPHPRSLKGIKLNAQSWGMKSGLNFAEAFSVVRILR